MDFTLKKYTQLLNSFKQAGFSFQTFEQFLQNPQEKVIILRHDVDLRAHNSLVTAQIENQLGICGSYYFRVVKESNNPEIIKQIKDLGHEIGYHYETMDTVSSKVKVQRLKFKVKEEEKDFIMDGAYEEFCKNLDYFRTFYPVKTICMHGSPLSKYDNKDIWTKYNYKNLGLIGEPYFDIDFSEVLYLTDTGRRWDGDKVSVRDKVKRIKDKGQSKSFDQLNTLGSSDNSQLTTFNRRSVSKGGQNSEPRTFNRRSVSKGGQNPEPRTHLSLQDAEPVEASPLTLSFRHTKDIIKAIESNQFPNQAMITVHPQRWNDSIISWTKELVMQNIKNILKRGLIGIRERRKEGRV